MGTRVGEDDLEMKGEINMTVHPANRQERRSEQREAAASVHDIHTRITARAYELYVERGCREGCAWEDWLDAEREIMSRQFPVESAAHRGDAR